MTNNKKMFSFIIILFFVLAGVTIGLIYFAYNITKFTTYSANTKVANVNISGLFGDEAEKELTNETLKWVEGASVNLVLQNYTIKIDTKEFKFNVKESINKVRSGNTSSLIVDINREIIAEKIQNDPELIKKGYIDYNLDIDKIKNEMILKASSLKYNVSVDLGTYVTEDHYQEIKSVTLNNIANNRAGYLARLKKVDISPKKFSLINSLKPVAAQEEVTLTNYDLSVIASGVYQLILDTNFTSINKHIGNELPNYLKTSDDNGYFGYEALINVEKNLDLTFYNPNNYTYKVILSYVEASPNSLTFTLVGVPFIEEIDTSINSVKFNSKEQVIRYVDICPNGLPTNGGNVCEGSRMGNRTFVTRTIKDSKNIVRTILINEDVYMPSYVVTIQNPNKE